MQKRGDLQGLVKGLFLTGKKFFPVGSLPDQINREPFGPTGPQPIISQQTSSGNLGVCLKREPASQQYLEN